MFSALARFTPAIRPHLRPVAMLGLALVLASALAGALSRGGIALDFGNFYVAGQKALAGETDNLFDPKALVAGKRPHSEMAFFSAPITAYLYAPLALLEPRPAMQLFKLENALAILAALLLLYRHTRRLAGGEEVDQHLFAAAFALMAVLFMPLWTVFRVGGQTTPTVLLLLVGALLAHTSERMVLSALLLLGAAMLKPFLAPCLAFVALTSGWRFFIALAASTAAMALASVLLMGWPVHAAFLEQVIGIAQAAKLPQLNSSLSAGFETLLLAASGGSVGDDKPLIVSLFATAIRVGVLALVAWLYLGARTGISSPAARRHFTFVLAIVFALLFTPVVWAHYLSFLFVLIATLAALWRTLPKAVLAILGLTVLSSIGQHVRIVQWIDSHIGFDSVALQFAVAQFKGIPLLLTVILLLAFRDAIYAAYNAPAWRQWQSVEGAS